ncbi:MAG TPA: competence/damage-inducible protein A, partial [Rhizobiales bacterium]|nr:competence/damage-inducible protein A [Hyphomicrobiales bacterium]
MDEQGQPDAGLLLIGDELLSGRTQDRNFPVIAQFLAERGIDLCEVRVISDVEDDIVAAVNALRSRYTYVLTTGGIGPTHDDITADAIARAFGVEIIEHRDAVASLNKLFA